MLSVFVMDGFYNNHQLSTLLPLDGGVGGNEYTVFVSLWPAMIKSLSSLPVKEAFTHLNLSKKFSSSKFFHLGEKKSLVYSSFIHLFILVSVFQNFGSFTKTLITFVSFKGGTATLPVLLHKCTYCQCSLYL